jgi:Mrp family chromosome partitioning ATPase
MDRRAPRKPAAPGTKTRTPSTASALARSNGYPTTTDVEVEPPAPSPPREVRVATAPEEPDLRSALRVLNRRRSVILATIVFFVAMGSVVTMSRPSTYQATAELLLRRPSAVISAADDAGDPDRVIRNEIRFIESQVTRDLVLERLGHAGTVTVTGSEGDDLLTIVAESDDPEEAATLANAYAQAYLDLRAEDLQAEADALRAQIAGIDQRLAQANPADNVAALTEKRAGLESALLDIEPLITGVGSGPRLVTSAVVPAAETSRGLLANVIATAIIGALLGCVVAVAIEVLSRRVHDETDLERVTAVPTLTTLDVRKRRSRAAHAEIAHRALRSVLFPPNDGNWPKVIAITSLGHGNATARIVAGLGASCAKAGHRVLLVGADLHHSRLDAAVGVSDVLGLATVLGDGVPLDKAVRAVPDSIGISVVVAGDRGHDSEDDLLASPRASTILQHMRNRGELVLIEAAPVEEGGDGLTVASQADATVLIVRGGTKQAVVDRAVRQLERAGAKLHGTVLVLTKSRLLGKRFG